MIFTHDVFVAYAGPDRGLAVELVRELQARRLSVCWDGVLKAEDSFDTAIPTMLSACRMFTIIVSLSTWNGQHHATDELAIAVQHARYSHMVIIPIWISHIAIEDRPYGIATKVGVSLPENTNCLGCVAGRLVEVILRTRLEAANRRL